jgi:hypothetical protein
VLVAVGFGLVAYGAVDRERGPVWLGVAVLTAFVLLAGAGNLLWWPLILLLAGMAAIAAGLRPTTAAPPAPNLDRPEAPRPFDPTPDPFLCPPASSRPARCASIWPRPARPTRRRCCSCTAGPRTIGCGATCGRTSPRTIAC